MLSLNHSRLLGIKAAAFFAACATLASADNAQLREMYEQNRLFELRRALDQQAGDTPDLLFYRAVAASCFGHESQAIELLRQVIATDPVPQIGRDANEELASAFERRGAYKEAAQARDQALKFTPARDASRADSENTRDLMSALSDIPPQTIEFGADVSITATRNNTGSWSVPVVVNGVKGDWIFDTAANLSLLSASEARRMGLSVRESKSYVGGSTGKKNKLQLAVGDLQFGGAHLHNSVFLVVADESLTIAPLHIQITGILGLPVLRALGRVGISGSGAVSMHPPIHGASPEPNLFFNELTPMVEVEHNGHRLQMLLDTGANASELYPSFRAILEGREQADLKSKREHVGGAGKTIRRKTLMAPSLQIQILGNSIELKDVSVIPKEQPGNLRFRDGVIGMDALWNGFVLDFYSMRLELQ